jgi:hypothetical protein
MDKTKIENMNFLLYMLKNNISNIKIVADYKMSNISVDDIILVIDQDTNEPNIVIKV